jgi:hypothetical protein
MATVTISGKVKTPDGSIPSGSLEFTAVRKVAGATGTIKAPIPAAASIAGDATVSAALEAGEQYDVQAVLTGARPGRYSQGRWLSPAAGAFTNPHLFDAWRNTLAIPQDALLAVADFTQGALTKSPKRAALDVWTSATAVFSAVGLVLDTTKTCTIPLLDNLLPGLGTLILKMTPAGWGGGDSAQHTIVAIGSGTNGFHLSKNTSNRLIFDVFDTGGSEKSIALDVTNGTLAADTAHRLAIRWNGGVLKVRLNGTDGAVAAGAGTGILSSLASLLSVNKGWLDAQPTGNLTLGAIRIYNRDLTDVETTGEMAGI